MTSAARAAEPSKGKTKPRRGAALLRSRSYFYRSPSAFSLGKSTTRFLRRSLCGDTDVVPTPAFSTRRSYRGLAMDAELVKHSSKQLFF